VFPAQPFPGRSKELERQTGVKARIASFDPFSDKTSQFWGGLAAGYAEPWFNNVKMRNYEGGKNPEERHTEHHELGHIYGGDNGWTRFVGGVGRGWGKLSNDLGNSLPFSILLPAW